MRSCLGELSLLPEELPVAELAKTSASPGPADGKENQLKHLGKGGFTLLVVFL